MKNSLRKDPKLINCLKETREFNGGTVIPTKRNQLCEISFYVTKPYIPPSAFDKLSRKMVVIGMRTERIDLKFKLPESVTIDGTMENQKREVDFWILSIKYLFEKDKTLEIEHFMTMIECLSEYVGETSG